MYLTYLLLQIYDFITLRITSSKEIYRSFLELEANMTCIITNQTRALVSSRSRQQLHHITMKLINQTVNCFRPKHRIIRQLLLSIDRYYWSTPSSNNEKVSPVPAAQPVEDHRPPIEPHTLQVLYPGYIPRPTRQTSPI